MSFGPFIHLSPAIPSPSCGSPKHVCRIMGRSCCGKGCGGKRQVGKGLRSAHSPLLCSCLAIPGTPRGRAAAKCCVQRTLEREKGNNYTAVNVELATKLRYAVKEEGLLTCEYIIFLIRRQFQNMYVFVKTLVLLPIARGSISQVQGVSPSILRTFKVHRVFGGTRHMLSPNGCHVQ